MGCKNKDIVTIHEWKMLVKYGVINLELCSLLLLLKSGRHHGGGWNLRKAGQKNVCRNSYCLQRNLRGGLQFCQRQVNCILHLCHCLSSLLVVSVIIVHRCWLSSFVLFVHLCRRCQLLSMSSSFICAYCLLSVVLGCG